MNDCIIRIDLRIIPVQLVWIIQYLLIDYNNSYFFLLYIFLHSGFTYYLRNSFTLLIFRSLRRSKLLIMSCLSIRHFKPTTDTLFSFTNNKIRYYEINFVTKKHQSQPRNVIIRFILPTFPFHIKSMNTASTRVSNHNHQILLINQGLSRPNVCKS